MLKGKVLYSTKIKDYKSNGDDVEFCVYGVFTTEKVLWNYYVISCVGINGSFKLTGDLCQYAQNATYETIRTFGKQFKTKEEGIEFIQEYKDKWEYGSNDTRQEKRDQKINDVLGGENQ